MYEIVATGDGSHTVLNRTLNATYHSRNGALTESRHVFIKAGLEYCCERALSKAPTKLALARNCAITVLEVGLGTGLNALLAYQYATNHKCPVHYMAVEPSPLPAEIFNRLGYQNLLQMRPGDMQRILQINDGKSQKINDFFTIQIEHCQIQSYKSDGGFDLVFYDAFGPAEQADMWTREVFEHISVMLRSGAVLVTFCAQGQFKRHLRDLGFKVESLPGPPGKREMIRAVWSGKQSFQ